MQKKAAKFSLIIPDAMFTLATASPFVGEGIGAIVDEASSGHDDTTFDGGTAAKSLVFKGHFDKDADSDGFYAFQGFKGCKHRAENITAKTEELKEDVKEMFHEIKRKNLTMKEMRKEYNDLEDEYDTVKEELEAEKAKTTPAPIIITVTACVCDRGNDGEASSAGTKFQLATVPVMMFFAAMTRFFA